VSDLSKIVDAASKTEGVIGVFLFGSLARGDYDEFSDYDLLVVFADKGVMWRNWDALFEAVGGLRMNLHMIPETVEELKSANPVFLDDLFRNGMVLFARLPLEVFPQPLRLEPYCLIVYDMGGLSYRDKMRIVYLLFRKGGVGTVAKMGGIKLSEGCLLVPNSAADEIVDELKALGVGAKKLEICVSEEQIKSILGQKQSTHQRKC